MLSATGSHPRTLAPFTQTPTCTHKRMRTCKCSVSKWGHDFRPKYRKLRGIFDVIEGDHARIPVMAMTATATRRVRADISDSLFKSSPLGVQPYECINTFHRPNLMFSVHHSRTTRGHTILEDLAPFLPVQRATSLQNKAHRGSLDDFLRTSGATRLPRDRQGLGKRGGTRGTGSILCPMCGQRLSRIRGKSIDALVDNHIDGGCKPVDAEAECSGESDNGAGLNDECCGETPGDEISIKARNSETDSVVDIDGGSVCDEALEVPVALTQSFCESASLKIGWQSSNGRTSPAASPQLDSPTVSDAHGLKCAGVTIIYLPTRKEVERITKVLLETGVAAAAYHAGLPARELQTVHAQFLSGELQVVAATVAFGMGINKHDVRNVIHYGWPQSLEQYHQEAGRAGRDGLPSRCALFVDMTSMPSLMPPSKGGHRSEEQTLYSLKALMAMHRYAVRHNRCRQQQLLSYFDENGSQICRTCDVCRAGGHLGVVLDDGHQNARRLLQAVKAVVAPRSVDQSESKETYSDEQIGQRVEGFSRERGRRSSAWKQISRMVNDSSGHCHGKTYWRGLARLLMGMNPPLLREACGDENLVENCKAGPMKVVVPTICWPQVTREGEDFLRSAKQYPPLLTVRSEADMFLMDETRFGGGRLSHIAEVDQAVNEPGDDYSGKRSIRTGSARAARAPRKPRTCFRCGETGHRVRSCPLNGQCTTDGRSSKRARVGGL